MSSRRAYSASVHVDIAALPRDLGPADRDARARHRDGDEERARRRAPLRGLARCRRHGRADIWTAAAALGIAARARASEVAFDVLKFAGALYLTWIGIQMLRSRRPRRPPGRRAAPRAARRRCGRGCSATSGIRRSPSSSRACCRSSSTGPGRRSCRFSFSGSLFALLTLLWLAAYALAVGHASGLPAPPGGAEGARPGHGRRADRIQRPAGTRASLDAVGALCAEGGSQSRSRLLGGPRRRSSVCGLQKGDRPGRVRRRRSRRTPAARRSR